MGFTILISYSGWAHDDKEAFFEIYSNGNSTIVDAEFPWTIRRALLKANPSLEKIKTSSLFMEGFKQYVKENFQLFDQNGESLTLLDVQLLPNDGHSHSGKYRFIYNSNNYTKIRNTLMFNLSDKQKNYHELIIRDQGYKFKTTPKTPFFDLQKNQPRNFNYLWSLLLIPIFIIIYIQYSKYKKKSS